MAPRILIFGTGSIGTVYAYIFSRNLPASNIAAICRSNYDAASTNGFTINSALWGHGLKIKPLVFKSVEEAVEASSTPFDYVVVCAKALLTTPSTAERISKAVSHSTTIVLIQNGIGIETPFATKFPQNPLLSTVVYLPATQISPAVVEHNPGIELLHVGTYPTEAPQTHKEAAESFVDLLRSAGATAELHDDVQEERWAKALLNTPWNPICALTRSRDAEFLASSPDSAYLATEVMLEVAMVAQAMGYKSISKEKVQAVMSRVTMRSLPGIQPSMLADVFNDNNVEVDALVANVISLAEEKGITAPHLKTISILLRALDASITRTKGH